MVNYGFGMPTRLVADGDVARWCGRLVAHYGGTRALVLVAAGTSLKEGVEHLAIDSLDRALLDYVEFRLKRDRSALDPALVEEAALLGVDEKVDFVLAIGDVSMAEFAHAVSARLAELTASDDGFFPYGCVLTDAEAGETAATSDDRVPVFAIVAPELLSSITEPLAGALARICAAA